MKPIIAILFQLCVTSLATTSDSCMKVCSMVPSACSTRDGSYCKGTICHELFWKDPSKSGFTDNRNKEGRTDWVVSCPEASAFVATRQLTSTAVTSPHPPSTKCMSSSSYIQTTVTTAPATPISISTVPQLPLQSRGLINLGNTCYFNSIIQALSHSNAFRGMILDVPDSEVITPAGLVLDAFRGIILEQQIESLIPIDPFILFDTLHEFGESSVDDRRIFVLGRSDDANIALGIVFDAIFMAIMQRTGSDQLIRDRLGMDVMIQRTCRVCARNAPSIQSIWLHRLEIHSLGRETAFEDVLRNYLESEHEVLCEACGRDTIHSNVMSFGNNRFLSFFLNRYQEGGGRIDTSIVIPPFIDMSTVHPRGTGLYRLVSVVLYNGGHYFTDVLDQDSDRWMRMDDSNVHVIAEPETSGSRPLLVFYEAIE